MENKVSISPSIIYQVESLCSARKFFRENINVKAILVNPKGSTHYYGMRVIDHIFKQLISEFPNQIIDFKLCIDADYAAEITAKKLGYKAKLVQV